jgi:hypothetical protein
MSGGGGVALSFSGSGCLAAYQFGAARCLVRNGGPLMRKVTHVLGCSGGSLVAAVLCKAPGQIELAIQHSLLCKNMSGVEAALAAVGPSAFRHGSTGESQSQPQLVIATATAGAPREERFHEEVWESNEDLLACLRASCHIPPECVPHSCVSCCASHLASAGCQLRHPESP